MGGKDAREVVENDSDAARQQIQDIEDAGR